MGRSWSLLAAPEPLLGASLWSHWRPKVRNLTLGRLGAAFGSSWSHLGPVQVRTWPFSGRSCGFEGGSWAALGRSWRLLGRSWVLPCGHIGALHTQQETKAGDQAGPRPSQTHCKAEDQSGRSGGTQAKPDIPRSGKPKQEIAVNWCWRCSRLLSVRGC